MKIKRKQNPKIDRELEMTNNLRENGKEPYPIGTVHYQIVTNSNIFFGFRLYKWNVVSFEKTMFGYTYEIKSEFNGDIDWIDYNQLNLTFERARDAIISKLTDYLHFE